jgi:hypothetical protein
VGCFVFSLKAPQFYLMIQKNENVCGKSISFLKERDSGSCCFDVHLNAGKQGISQSF